MKRSLRYRSLLLVAVLISATMSACDFQAVEDAFDDFQVIIGLDPINTPVTGLVSDQSSGFPLDATLQMGGPGASSLVDAYNDPLDPTVEVDGGIVTFGVSNGIVPSEGSPFEFTVTASAPGYYTKTVNVFVTEVGGLDVNVNMVRVVDATSNVQGTSAVQDNSVQSDQSGAVQQAVTVQTQSNVQNNSQATATATVSAGTVPTTSTGQPLTGQIQTQMRAYDPSQGTSSLPQQVTQAGDGSNQAVFGALFFRMTDSNGNAASNFSSSGSGKNALAKSGACADAGGLEVTVSIENASLYDFVTLVDDTAGVDGYNPKTGIKAILGEITLRPGMSPEVFGDLCVGGMLSNVDTTPLGDLSEGVFFSLYTVYGSTTYMTHTLTINNPSVIGVPGRISIEGPGLSGHRDVTFPGSQNTKSLASWINTHGSYRLFDNSEYTITLEPDAGNPVSVKISDFSSGSSELTLSPSSVTRNYSATASFSCPDNTHFEVGVDEASLSNVSVIYARIKSFAPLTYGPSRSITASDITSRSTDSRTFISITGNITAIAGETYRIVGALGVNWEDVEVTAPTGTNNWTIPLTTEDIGFECVAD